MLPSSERSSLWGMIHASDLRVRLEDSASERCSLRGMLPASERSSLRGMLPASERSSLWGMIHASDLRVRLKNRLRAILPLGNVFRHRAMLPLGNASRLRAVLPPGNDSRLPPLGKARASLRGLETEWLPSGKKAERLS
ncbi:unnamed protein product [Linum trigynum]|uniref:Uncharacterized protein n=1 Tax=Linum trigynum TaxID=586398 RepID=A0AAV2CNY7_9ROSI